jgi:hypothetical protein
VILSKIINYLETELELLGNFQSSISVMIENITQIILFYTNNIFPSKSRTYFIIFN